jgi:hypothetical protein
MYRTLFDEYVSAGIKNFGRVSGRVEGIGSGQTNTVFSLESTPFCGAERESGRCFHGKVAACGVIVIVDPETDTQVWHIDGALIRPVSILSTETAGGTETLNAVFEPAFENGKHRFGFLLVTEKGVAFAAEVVAGTRKRGADQPRMVMRHKTLLTYQKEHAGASQSGWVFENNKAQAVAAGVGEASSTCSLSVQLLGSCVCRAIHRSLFGWDLQGTYAGFAELPKDCRCFMELYFGNPTYKSGCRSGNTVKGCGGGTRSKGGATFANLSMGQAKERHEKCVSLYDSAEVVTATLRMTVGVLTDMHEATAVAPPEQTAARLCEVRIETVMDLIRLGSSPEVAYIKENTFTIEGNVLAIAVRYHDGKDDDIGRPVSIADVIRNADVILDGEVITAKLNGREIGYRVELDFLLRVTVFVVHKVSTQNIGLKAIYAKPVNGQYEFEPEEKIELCGEGECYELPYPLQKEAGEEIDGWNLEVTIDGKQHVLKLRFFEDGLPYTAEAEAVQAALAPEPVHAPVAAAPVHAPVAPEPVQVEAGAPEESIMTWMADMGHADLAKAAGAVQMYGFTDLADVKRASVADIDDMLSMKELGWTRLHQGRFKRKWEEMQI